ncbi:hypothetical protein HG263_20380 [Pseudoalteromonas sp. JBTF-M23]|uniref:Uncharacterized protein n=1 Tax=Pseudoalteromonas caenipelagi TaxID=2726988 RepID=A0A849VHV1_9GAMM|nr:hypothetical protein [Pseudoalteromonas caenipelagi]NOU52865.1 hypothetical protein [Pseudoalteromonas caenipelagi]
MAKNSSEINHLALKPVGHYDNLGLIFDVYIDRVCLLTLISEYEKRFHKRLYGAYTAALGCRDILYRMDDINAKEQVFMPYACDCGAWECWFFQGVITSYDDFVFWGQWRNSHRSDKSKKSAGLYWCYKDFPTLCFDKTQYLAEINKAQALVKADKMSMKMLGLST